MSKNKYNAAIYLRLSKEDGDKEESYSIGNQRDLAKQFLSSYPEIYIKEEMIDDGFTGTNFNRPAFKAMLEKITKGEINCVVVKDLSRFARDYIGSGYYLEKLFPTLGVRFISINDNIDTGENNSANDNLIMSFKNILNDSYVRDISIKIRSQFEIKRKKGEYVGAFTVFGYAKSPDNKHKLVIDKNAAEIVKNIFAWRIEGQSAAAIAKKLNLLSVPSPSEYKKMSGSNFSANLQKKHEALWSAKAVIRILTNEIYTGTLIQGKSTTANYKVNKVIEKERSEWNITENAHEAIISREIFETAQNVLKRDTRTNPGRKKPYLFSGFLFCADCGASMVRRKVKDRKSVYVYYMCSVNKLKMGCSSHRVNENILYEAVKSAIDTYCDNILELSDVLKAAEFADLETIKIRKIQHAVEKKQLQIGDLSHTLSVIQKRYKNNLDSKTACDELTIDIQKEISALEQDIIKLADEKRNVSKEITRNNIWIKTFTATGEIKELSRSLLANLIEKIYVHEDKRIVVKFRFQDKYEQLISLTKKLNKEAV